MTEPRGTDGQGQMSEEIEDGNFGALSQTIYVRDKRRGNLMAR